MDGQATRAHQGAIQAADRAAPAVGSCSPRRRATTGLSDPSPAEYHECVCVCECVRERERERDRERQREREREGKEESV